MIAKWILPVRCAKPAILRAADSAVRALQLFPTWCAGIEFMNWRRGESNPYLRIANAPSSR